MIEDDFLGIEEVRTIGLRRGSQEPNSSTHHQHHHRHHHNPNCPHHHHNPNCPHHHSNNNHSHAHPRSYPHFIQEQVLNELNTLKEQSKKSAELSTNPFKPPQSSLPKPPSYIPILTANLFLSNFTSGVIIFLFLSNTEHFKYTFTWSNTYTVSIAAIYQLCVGFGNFFSIMSSSYSYRASVYFSIIFSLVSFLLTLPICFLTNKVYYFIYIWITSFSNGQIVATLSNYVIQKLIQRNREVVFYICTACGYISALFVNNMLYYLCGYFSKKKLNIAIAMLYICWPLQFVLLRRFIRECKYMKELKEKMNKQQKMPSHTNNPSDSNINSSEISPLQAKEQPSSSTKEMPTKQDFKTLFVIPCLTLASHKLKHQALLAMVIYCTIGINFYSIETDTSHFPYKRPFYNNNLIYYNKGLNYIVIALLQVMFVFGFTVCFVSKKFSFKQLMKVCSGLLSVLNVLLSIYWKDIDKRLLIGTIAMLEKTVHMVVVVMVRMYALEIMGKKLRLIVNGLGMVLFRIASFIVLVFGYGVGVEFKYGFHLINCAIVVVLFGMVNMVKIEKVFMNDSEVCEEMEMILRK